MYSSCGAVDLSRAKIAPPITAASTGAMEALLHVGILVRGSLLCCDFCFSSGVLSQFDDGSDDTSVVFCIQ
jgi:hypothetical protein